MDKGKKEIEWKSFMRAITEKKVFVRPKNQGLSATRKGRELEEGKGRGVMMAANIDGCLPPVRHSFRVQCPPLYLFT